MKLTNVAPLILLPLLLITGCGDVVKKDENGTKETPGDVVNLPAEINNTLPGDINTTIPPDINNTLPIVENNATFDFKDYFPILPKTVNCTLSETGVSLSPTITYGGSENNISVESDYDGLDLFEYVLLPHYKVMDTTRNDRNTLIWFDEAFIHLKREGNETRKIPRYFNDEGLLVWEGDSDINITIAADNTYTEFYVNDMLICTAQALGDYNISNTLYTNALAINCVLNDSKGNTQNGVTVVNYNYDYNSSTVLLPNMGIVYTQYISSDMNFSVECQP